MAETVKMTQEDLERLVNEMKDSFADNPEMSDGIDSMVRLLMLDDAEFAILAPTVMQTFQKSLNNPVDKIALVQVMNAQGLYSEDISSTLPDIEKIIDELSLSTQKRDFIKEFLFSILNAVIDTEGIAKKIINIPVERMRPEVQLPQYAHITDSGMDIFALEDITINPGETKLIPTGLKFAIPVGYELQVRPKSGRCLKSKLRVANTPGTIDVGYRDEVGVIIENVDPPIKDITIDDDGHVLAIDYGAAYTIGAGEKFAQLVLCEVPKAALHEVNSVLDYGEDRGGGFGSTGLTNNAKA